MPLGGGVQQQPVLYPVHQLQQQANMNNQHSPPLPVNNNNGNNQPPPPQPSESYPHNVPPPED
jgi:hypothetical protein